MQPPNDRANSTTTVLLGAALLVAVLPAYSCGGKSIAQTRSDTPRTAAFTAVTADENLVTTTVNVDQGLSSLSATRGTQRVFRTISAAIQYAEALVRKGTGVRVAVHPGVYREQITLSEDPSSSTAPLVIDGNGRAIVSGADVWTGWQQTASGTWVHAWPYNWGNAPYPPGWEGNVVLDPIVTRREMVIVDGRMLRQVLYAQQLIPGTFFVSELSQTVTAMVSPDVDLSSSTVEVAVRSPLFKVQGKRNVVVRGMTFQYANTALPDAAVEITDSTGVLIDGCSLIWNNWNGLNVLTSQDVTIRGVNAGNNGGSGIGGYELVHLLVSASETSSNNWRGAWGGFTGWDVAGSKFVRVHDGLFRQYTSSNNQARGLWLDTDVQNVTIESSRFEGNLRDAIFLEANQGPLVIAGSRMSGSSSGAGIAGATTAYVTLTGNVISDNNPTQILITGDADRNVSNWQTGAQFDLRAEAWTACGNTIISSSDTALSSPNWPWFIDSIRSDWNMWTSSGGNPDFVLGGQNKVFSAWRNTTHQDLHSLVATGNASLPDAIADNIAQLCSGIQNTQ